jgi:hypothetical protein
MECDVLVAEWDMTLRDRMAKLRVRKMKALKDCFKGGTYISVRWEYSIQKNVFEVIQNYC